jgi:DNA-binding MarR family transcriptional regulator
MTGKPWKSSNPWVFEDNIGCLARLVFRSFTRLLEQHSRQYGLSAAQWAFLREFSRGDGISQRELSCRSMMPEATIAVTLRALERRGLVCRKINGRDRRKMLVHLTPHGRRVKELLLTPTAEMDARATQGLSNIEVDALRRLLLQTMENLSRVHRDLLVGRRTLAGLHKGTPQECVTQPPNAGP